MPGAGPVARRARRFLIGCPLGWAGSACFASGVSCTRPPAHEAYRPARRVSGYTACSCSRHSIKRFSSLCQGGSLFFWRQDIPFQ